MPEFPSSVEEAVAADPLLVGRQAMHSFAFVAGPEGVLHEGRFWRVVTGYSHPLGNMCVILNDQDPTLMCEAIAPFAGLPSCVRCASEPSPAVQDVLLTEGYELQVSIPNMAVDTARLPHTALPDGYLFQRVYQERCDAFEEAISAVFPIPEFFLKWMLPTVAKADSGYEDACQWFAIWKGDRMVATSILTMIGGIAGIYCVATIEEERGKGLGAHVTAEPLRVAATMGCQVGVLQASAMGLPVYDRLGFREVNQAAQYVRTP